MKYLRFLLKMTIKINSLNQQKLLLHDKLSKKIKFLRKMWKSSDSFHIFSYTKMKLKYFYILNEF